ncbi:MAG: Mth938-like domain-containing protein [Alphaproteobacteria bacterium]|nr:Mth938-like domain-containing protein [Alphaproteobacteria bacterium]
MDVTPAIHESRQVITGYGGGGFKINGEFKHGSMLVFADRMVPLEIHDSAIELTHIQPVLERHDVELLLIGTGKQMRPIDPTIRAALKARSTQCDVMDTGAACRTYNVLQSEERRVAALVVAI